MTETPRTVDAYLERLARHDNPLLKEMEARAARERFPIIGPVAGRVLYQVARLLTARRIFELGSGYGYSTYWFALALDHQGGGEIFHTVWNEQLSREARGYLARANLKSQIHFTVGEAVAALSSTPGPFDLIFNDIDKEGYPASLDVIKAKLRPGGALLIDNMLWSGRVLTDDQSPATQGIRRATDMLFTDPDFVSSLLPVRDGVVLSIYQPGKTLH